MTGRIERERRFADPAYRPNWRAGPGRPPWRAVGPEPKRQFSEWVNRKLDQLDRIAAAVHRVEINSELTPEVRAKVGAALVKALSGAAPFLEARAAGIRMVKPKATFNEMAKIERRQELRAARGQEGEAGRTASGVDETTPNALAAWDMWRIRKVIFPRFWPEEAAKGWRRNKLDVAKIAAARHPGATPEAAHHWYEKQRLSSRDSK